MRRWTSTIGALLLVLMLWTGGRAHAAGVIELSPATEATFHLERTDEKSSGEREGRSGHFHLNCGGHCLATPADSKTSLVATIRKDPPVALQSLARFGDGPKLTLRPPIA